MRLKSHAGAVLVASDVCWERELGAETAIVNDSERTVSGAGA